MLRNVQQFHRHDAHKSTKNTSQHLRPAYKDSFETFPTAMFSNVRIVRNVMKCLSTIGVEGLNKSKINIL